MRRYLLLGTISLLTLVSCKKQSPDPAPALTGRWEWVRTTSTHYTSTGGVWYEQLLDPTDSSGPGPTYLLVTPDSIIHHYQTGVLRTGYKRAGDTLTVTPGSVSSTLHELSAQRLLLRTEYYVYRGGRLTERIDAEYSR